MVNENGVIRGQFCDESLLFFNLLCILRDLQLIVLYGLVEVLAFLDRLINDLALLYGLVYYFAFFNCLVDNSTFLERLRLNCQSLILYCQRLILNCYFYGLLDDCWSLWLNFFVALLRHIPAFFKRAGEWEGLPTYSLILNNL